MPSAAQPSWTAEGKQLYRSTSATASGLGAAGPKRALAHAAIASDVESSLRVDTSHCSFATAPASGKTIASSSTPARRAASSEQTMIAAPMSTITLEASSFVYGAETIRFDGDAAVTDPSPPPSRSHAPAVVLATSRIRAARASSLARCPTRSSPAARRSACSKRAYVLTGRARPHARSGSLSASGAVSTTGAAGTSSPWWRHATSARRRLARSRLFMASAPTTTATSSSPAAIRVAASRSAVCGTVPPGPVTRVARGEIRSDSAAARAGSRGDQTNEGIAVTSSTRSRSDERRASPPAASPPARESASTISSSGSCHVDGSSAVGRAVTWPTPAITGVRGSIDTSQVCREDEPPIGGTVGCGRCGSQSLQTTRARR